MRRNHTETVIVTGKIPIQRCQGHVSRAFRIFLAMLVVIVSAPSAISATLIVSSIVLWTSPAIADDDDDDDDDDRPRAPRRAAAQAELVAMIGTGQSTVPLEAEGFTVVRRSTLAAAGNDIVRVRSTRGESVTAALRRLRSLLPGRPVGLNTLYRPSRLACSAANCPKFSMVGWPTPPKSCAMEATIGMIDTGVQPNHPAFRAGAIETIDLRTAGRRASSDRHGTAIAALLIGRADGAHPGLLPRARLVAVDVFHRAKDGGDAADAFDLVRGLDLLVARSIRLINLSLTGPDNPVLRQAVETALASDVILVAAAGNAGPSARPVYPGAYQGVIAVTAVDRKGRLFRRANRGNHIAFAAPGVNLVVADTRGRSRSRSQSGTSLAVPFVTAAMAVAMKTNDHKRERLLETLQVAASDLGRPGRDREFGWGLIQMPANASNCLRPNP